MIRVFYLRAGVLLAWLMAWRPDDESRRCDRCNDERLLARAEQFLADGDVVPAGMTARVVLERRLRLLCNQHGCPQNRMSGVGTMAKALRRAGYLDYRQSAALRMTIDRANKLAHGRSLSVKDAALVVSQVRRFCDTLLAV